MSRWRQMSASRRRAVVLATAAAAAVGMFGGVSLALSPHCPPDTHCVTMTELRRGEGLPEAIHIFDREGQRLADVAGPLRHVVPADRIPRLMADAFVAVEDRRFWDHDGVDFRGVLRAAFRDAVSRDIEEGASTIPMQLVRTLWAPAFADMSPWRRKLIEARMAPRLVDELGRNQVLALYMNAIYLGDGVYGVGAAARHYFDTSVDSLDLAQVATLVGMTQSPERYQPRRHPDQALQRRNVVLGVLAAQGVVTPREAQAARELPVETVDVPPVQRGRSYFTAAVTREIRRVAPELAGRPGLNVYTTVDRRIQASGEKALHDQLAAIEQGRYGRFRVRDTTQVLQGAAVSLDAATGAIRAWVGGRDFSRSEFDRVSQARRQIGSLVKPFLVATALGQGLGIVDLVASDSLAIPTAQGATWSPADHVNAPALPMREALVRSSNRAAVHLGEAVGLDQVRQVGLSLGLAGPIPQVPSSLIGAFEASLVEMAGAYAPFDNGGYRIEPWLIERIEGPGGEVLWSHQPTPPRPVLDPATSFVILDALRAVVDRGTAAAVRGTGYQGPAAGKTGTTNDGKDAWFVGMVPGLVSGVWVGFDQPRTIVPGGSGGTLAAPAWGRWMSDVERDGSAPPTVWVPPLDVTRVRYDMTTGEVVDESCRSGPASSYTTGFVRTGQYRVGRCPSHIEQWISGIWHSLFPRRLEPVVGGSGATRPGG